MLISSGYTDFSSPFLPVSYTHLDVYKRQVYLFSDTIGNNIRFGRPDASMEEVKAAAKKARCYDFIMALPDAFDTVIG